MTRIAFVEVRDLTRLFSEIANQLQDHDVHWVVQNHLFSDESMTNLTVIPYPSRSDMTDMQMWIDDEDFDILQRVWEQDRFNTHFGASNKHYRYYLHFLRSWLSEVKPQVIFGEIGNFHSHLLALLAKKQGIPFLNPVTSRYPNGRFCFYLYDRMETTGEPPSRMQMVDIHRSVASIQEGSSRPDYMLSNDDKHSSMRYKASLFSEWMRGERFATQNPFDYIRARSRVNRSIRAWDLLCEQKNLALTGNGRPKVLYPLQMQPELNLDLWGHPFSNQAETIRQLAKNDCIVFVKANPKASLEMNNELLKVLSAENVVPLPRHLKMDEVETKMDLVVTVTGTVAIERALRNRAVLIMSQDYANWLGVRSAQDLGINPADLKLNNVARVTEYFESLDPTGILEKLANKSFPGVISAPNSDPSVLSDQNLDRLVEAFRQILSTETAR